MSDNPARDKRFAEIAEAFKTLGVKTFYAQLPEGRIAWVDENGQTVAQARCKAILSYATANQSVMWAWGLEHFAQAGVPTIAPDELVPVYMENVPQRNAEHLAMRAAEDDGAEFYYAAPSGEGSVLYLSIHDFTPLAPKPVGEG